MSVDAPLGATPQSGAFELTHRGAAELRHPLDGTRRQAWREHLLVTAIPVLGLLLCVAGTRTNTLVPESIRPVTATKMAGPLQHIGFTLGIPAVIGVILLLFASYLLAMRSIDRVSPRFVIGAIVALNVIVLIGPPLFSTDVFSYQAYARMFAVYHTNPYTHGPAAIGLDQTYSYIASKWIFTPSVYGPLFTIMSSAFASTTVATSELIFKLIAVCASGGTLYLIWKAARARGLNPGRGVAMFGLNPVVTLYGVGGGHNDLLMLFLTTWGVYAIITQRERAGGALLSLGAAIKLTGAVVFPFALLSGVKLGAADRRHRIVLGAAAAVAVIGVVSYLAFGTGILQMPGTLQAVQDKGEWQSIPGFLFAVTRMSVTHAVRLVVDVLLAGALLYLLRRVWQGTMDWIDGAAWAMFAVLVTAWAMLPWYVSWMIPLVALGTSPRLWKATVFMTMVACGMMIFDVIPHGIPLLNI